MEVRGSGMISSKCRKGGHISGIQLVVSPKTKHNLPHDPVIPLPVIYPGKNVNERPQ